MKNICLIGYMGSGKTTVGRLLADALSCDFEDTDEMIVEREGRPISDIFEKEGEPYFRRLETDLLNELCDKGLSKTVLSTGGGLPVAERNRSILKKIGKVVYLRAEAESLYMRVKEDKGRPLLETGDKLKKIREMLAVRGPIYEVTADFIIDTDHIDEEQTVKEIVNILKSS